MKHHIRAIVGPTATGKTALALKIAQKNPSIIISVDSRQVYKGMDIVTGKDHPDGSTIYGIDLVDPVEPCSVSVWYDAVSRVIKECDPQTQIILVGGTGLYLRAFTEGIATMSVPINSALRQELSSLPVEDLQLQLSTLDPVRASTMNHSDFHNPRRLIRAIEVALSPSLPTPNNTFASTQIIGLYYADRALHERLIEQRVRARVNLGAVQETQMLLKKYSKDLPSMTAIGYRSIIKYLEGELKEEQMIAQWVKDECAYAKRQLTFFRKYNVTWYDRGIIGDKEIML